MNSESIRFSRFKRFEAPVSHANKHHHYFPRRVDLTKTMNQTAAKGTDHLSKTLSNQPQPQRKAWQQIFTAKVQKEKIAFSSNQHHVATNQALDGWIQSASDFEATKLQFEKLSQKKRPAIVNIARWPLTLLATTVASPRSTWTSLKLLGLYAVPYHLKGANDLYDNGQEEKRHELWKKQLGIEFTQTLLGREDIQAGNPKQAFQRFQEALRDFPERADETYLRLAQFTREMLEISLNQTPQASYIDSNINDARMVKEDPTFRDKLEGVPLVDIAVNALERTSQIGHSSEERIMNIAEIYKIASNYEKAAEYAKLALERAQELSNDREAAFADRAASIHEAFEDYKTAIDYRIHQLKILPKPQSNDILNLYNDYLHQASQLTAEVGIPETFAYAKTCETVKSLFNINPWLQGALKQFDQYRGWALIPKLQQPLFPKQPASV